MRARLLAIGVAVAVGACQPAPLVNRTSFNPEEVAWSTRPGNNTVTGFAVLRTVGGEARTCAGLQARERLQGLSV